MWRYSALVLALLAVAGVNTLQARTVDGSTPAEEGVCDELTGAEFGLCNAYCEAQDCDARDPEPASCERLRRVFDRVTGGGEFPCDDMGCGDDCNPEPGPCSCAEFTAEPCLSNPAECSCGGDSSCFCHKVGVGEAVCITPVICELANTCLPGFGDCQDGEVCVVDNCCFLGTDIGKCAPLVCGNQALAQAQSFVGGMTTVGEVYSSPAEDAGSPPGRRGSIRRQRSSGR